MKQYVILTSVLALAACGGGSGGGGSSSHGGATVDIRPTITVEGFSAGTTVNANNTNLTNMSSYTVDYAGGENATKEAMVNYVTSHLGSSRGLLSRAATRNSMQSRDGFTPEEFAAADAAIQEMKQIVYDMVVASENSNAALRQYISQHKSYVINAMKLADIAVDDNATVDQIVTLFNTFKTTNSVTSENILAFGDQFDTQFGIEKHRLNEVKLKDTGTDAFFKFTLDNTGRIASVDLMENPMAEYGTSWTAEGTHGHDVKIVINGEGNATSVYDQGLNPFGNDGEYRMGEAGVLNRTGNGNAFTNTLYHYDFSGLFEAFSNSAVSEGDFADIEINSDKALTLAEAKQKLKDYIIKKVNMKMHNQHGTNPEPDGAVAAFVEAAQHYITAINALTEMPAVQTAAQTATMHGMGKDVQLKYSDFGYSKLQRAVPGEDPTYVTYVGGYDQRRMDNTPSNNNLQNGATFTGTAVVTVEDHDNNKITHSETTNTALYRDNSATLTYNVVNPTTAKHTLTMGNLTAIDGTFDANKTDWYTVVVTGTQGSNDMQISFDADGKETTIGENTVSTIDSRYQFFKADSEGNITRNQDDTIPVIEQVVTTNGSFNTIDMVDGTTSTVEGHHRMNGSFDAEYYGQDATNPTEATAGFHMDERWADHDNNIQHEVSVYGAFGGQKNPQ